MTNPTLKCALIGASLFAVSISAHAGKCTKDEAMQKYSKVTAHAAALQEDAEANPSKVPFQKGKNDPRVKKSVKISEAAADINENSIGAAQYNKACEELNALAKKYKISFGGEEVAKESKLKTGLKAASQANSIRNHVD